MLDQLLVELHRFLLILDRETLSGNATIQKGLLSDLLQSYKASNGMKEKLIIEVLFVEQRGTTIKTFSSAVDICIVEYLFTYKNVD